MRPTSNVDCYCSLQCPRPGKLLSSSSCAWQPGGRQSGWNLQLLRGDQAVSLREFNGSSGYRVHYVTVICSFALPQLHIYMEVPAILLLYILLCDRDHRRANFFNLQGEQPDLDERLQVYLTGIYTMLASLLITLTINQSEITKSEGLWQLPK
jgi:hypothetical protein